MASVTRTGNDQLNVCLHLAGHDRAVLVRADGKTGFVGEGGTALGLLETITSPDVAVTLGPGDSLIFYTDGVTERRRGAASSSDPPGSGTPPGRWPDIRPT